MSTKLHDRVNNALQYQETPASRIATLTGSARDMSTGDGVCHATQQVGVVSGTSPTWDGKIQEGDDTTTFTDVTGATFTQVTASTALQTIKFQRSKRYIRYVGTIGGSATPTFNTSVLIEEQKKQV